MGAYIHTTSTSDLLAQSTERKLNDVTPDEWDKVTNPDYYTKGSTQAIDYIMDKKMSFVEGNIIKYVTRYKEKNGIEDLRKAKWYLNRLIDYQVTKGQKD
jgi:hypothetical protein